MSFYNNNCGRFRTLHVLLAKWRVQKAVSLKLWFPANTPLLVNLVVAEQATGCRECRGLLTLHTRTNQKTYPHRCVTTSRWDQPAQPKPRVDVMQACVGNSSHPSVPASCTSVTNQNATQNRGPGPLPSDGDQTASQGGVEMAAAMAAKINAMLMAKGKLKIPPPLPSKVLNSNSGFGLYLNNQGKALVMSYVSCFRYLHVCQCPVQQKKL